MFQLFTASASFFCIAAPTGHIRLDLKTGDVHLPEGMPRTEAARHFWAAVKELSAQE